MHARACRLDKVGKLADELCCSLVRSPARGRSRARGRDLTKPGFTQQQSSPRLINQQSGTVRTPRLLSFSASLLETAFTHLFSVFLLSSLSSLLHAPFLFSFILSHLLLLLPSMPFTRFPILDSRLLPSPLSTITLYLGLSFSPFPLRPTKSKHVSTERPNDRTESQAINDTFRSGLPRWILLLFLTQFLERPCPSLFPVPRSPYSPSKKLALLCFGKPLS